MKIIPIKKIVQRLKRLIAASPENLFPLRPPLPLPDGITEEELFSFVTSIRVAGGSEQELQKYASNDFRRFVYTLGLVSELQGKCLELGANPYFTTMLLARFTGLDLNLANFFGFNTVGILSQEVFFSDSASSASQSRIFNYQHFNVESEAFPYADNEFDVIIFAEMIEHLLNDPCRVLREIKRVLKQGGVLIVTTPNVARLENVALLMSGENIYDRYSGYGPYGRHNREYTSHELASLLKFEGFDVTESFTADVHTNKAGAYADLGFLKEKLHFREHDLGQYIFIKATNAERASVKVPSWLYRSLPPDQLE